MDKLLILGVLLCAPALRAQYAVNYMGQNLFPLHSNATLACQAEPSPYPNDYTITWSQSHADGTSQKIGLSHTNPNSSFIYNTAPERLIGRFQMSSDKFDIGTAEATIMGIQIADEGTYVCDLSVQRASVQQPFQISVFSEPSVTISQVKDEFDIRPQMPTEAPAAESTETPTGGGATPGEEPPTDGAAMTESTEAPSTTPTASPLNEVAVCDVSHAYPMPSKIQFILMPGNSIIADVVPEVNPVSNDDGTYNATAALNTEVTEKFDRATILCRVVLSPELAYESAETAPYTVFHHPDDVRVHFSERQPKEDDMLTITCQANGNPTPPTTLRKPDGTEIANDMGYSFRVKREDQGAYTCIVDVAGEEPLTDTNTLIVQWMDAPVLAGTPSNGKLGLGSKLDVTCSAQGSPLPSYVWKKDGKTMENGDELTIDSVQFSDSGTYICEAEGAFSRQVAFEVTISSGCAVTVTKTISGSSEKSGEAYVDVTCAAVGSPECTVTISDADKTLATGTNEAKYVQQSVPKQMEPLQYTCKASNSINVTTVAIKLDDEPLCCVEPQTGGLGAGVIIIIILLIALVVVGIPLAWYCIKKRNKPSKDEAVEKGPDAEPTATDKLKADENDGA